MPLAAFFKDGIPDNADGVQQFMLWVKGNPKAGANISDIHLAQSRSGKQSDRVRLEKKSFKKMI